jgi:hypothetical protein
MRYARAAALTALAIMATLYGPAAASAVTGQPGGAQAPSSPKAGGSEYGVTVPTGARPVVSGLSVPAKALAGRPPRTSFRISEAGVGTVNAQVTLRVLSTHRLAVVARLGWVHTGRTVTVAWPTSAKLAPGSYLLSLIAHDHRGVGLLRRAHSSGVAGLTVTAPAKPAPKPSPAPSAPSAPELEAGVPTPAQTVADGAVFPVAGAHSFGGPENRYGAAREGHIHEGQDVLTAEGTPDVAPLAGTITWTSYQAGGAGYYAVEHTAIGFDFMFAHCMAGSLAVSAEQAVSAGQLLCKAGQTGDATAPHLHFEMWVGGWQSPTGHSIDPLPYLQAWER